MMLSFREFLTEAITPAVLETLRRDAGAFTKNIRRIQTGAELAQVAAAYSRWAKYLDDFIYKRLLGTNDYDFDHESYSAKQLREKVWTLVIADPFTDALSQINLDGLRQSGEFAYTDRTAPFWDKALTQFHQKRDSLYTKLSRQIREAFAALDQYVESHAHPDQPTMLPDHALRTTVSVLGVPVTIITVEGVKPSEWFQHPRETLEQFRTVFLAIRAAGFGSGLERLRFELFTTSAHGDMPEAAGNYDPSGLIRINIWGTNPHTIAHEVGHHFFRRLSGERRVAWEQFVKRNKLSFTPEDITELHRAYLDTFHHHAPTSHGYTIQDFWEKVADRLTPATKLKMESFMIARGTPERIQILMSPFVDGRDIDGPWNEFLELAQKGFLLNAPTAYSNANPEEAFCECFAIYVNQNHPLAPVVRLVFREVTGLD